MIALVISIIVMLILAGVSINAIVGDDGILSKTTYASFLSEMSAVEEAVQMWKATEIIEAQGDEVKAIPANGLCKAHDLTSAERLVGEVGYYRVWSLTLEKPSTDILSSADTFNSSFESELVFYPAGVQDLYYLNNDALEIKGHKTYLIDATTGMIYSMSGISLKGVRCYSSNMAKAVMSGNIEQPIFAEAEVSGTGSGEKLAGNVQSEYLIDENGNYILDENGNKIKNPDYNPNGFQMIADDTNNNIYKLYNNGDLYGKGIKGNLLNTNLSEMEKINSYVWAEMTLPENIPGSQDINSISLVPGNGTMFVIDIDQNLWAWGENHYNYLGLTQDEQLEFTGREAVKLNLYGKKAYRVIPTPIATWVITENNELYVCGYNNYGELGIGKINQQTDCFEKVEFNNPKNIKNITSTSDDYYDSASIDYRTMILMNDGKIYWAGNTQNINQNIFKNTDLKDTTVLQFTEIFNDIYGSKFQNKIVYIAKFGGWGSNYLILLDETGILYEMDKLGNINEIDNKVQKIVCRDSATVYQKEVNPGEMKYVLCPWGNGSWFNSLGISQEYKFIDITEKLEEIFDISKVKDFYITAGAMYFLLDDGKLYASGYNNEIGINVSSGISNGIVYLNETNCFDNIKELIYLNDSGATSKSGCFMLCDSNGKYYATGNGSLIYRNNILEGKWVKINPDGVKVKKFNAKTHSNSLAFIDDNNDIWVLGDDVRLLGINHEIDDLDLNNFVLLKNYLKDLEIYNHIDGKVSDYSFSKGSLYIKTNSEDNDTLYVCGLYEISSWPYYSYSGLEKDAYIPTKLFDSVNKFVADNQTGTMVLLKNNQLYIWGNNNGYMTSGINSKVPVLYENSDITNSKIKDIYISNFHGYIVLENGDIYATGMVREPDAANGLPSIAYTYTLLDKNIYFNEKQIKNIVFLGVKNVLFLTNDGNVFGCGNKRYLGQGTISLEQEFTPISLFNNSDVTQIIAGPSWFIIVKNDGTVFGTGENAYGILGRWKGVGRGESNSRYKTAFNWVECPELEI